MYNNYLKKQEKLLKFVGVGSFQLWFCVRICVYLQ